MGLRERNAARTRELIIDTALDLFLEHGYEATTMEDIAEAAEVGSSTLYRYFPSKEVLVIEPLAIRGHMAEEFSRRPPEEPLAEALGHAITALLTTPRGDAERISKIRAVVDQAPGPRARLVEDFFNERALLQEVVAQRLGRPVDDLFCAATARLATVVLELVAERTVVAPGDTDHGVDRIVDSARAVMAQLVLEPPALPTLPA